MIIVLDPGHEVNIVNNSRRGTGAHASGHDEAVYVQDYCRELAASLIAAGHDVTIVENSGMGNKGELYWVIGEINKLDPQPDIIISVHTDYSDNAQARGASVLYYSSAGRELAECLAPDLVALMPGRSKPVKRRTNLAVLKRTRAVAAMAELGFGTNEEDRMMMHSHRGELVSAMVKGVERYAALKGGQHA